MKFYSSCFIVFAVLYVTNGKNATNVTTSSVLPVSVTSTSKVVHSTFVTTYSGATSFSMKTLGPDITSTSHPNTTSTSHPNMTSTSHPNMTVNPSLPSSTLPRSTQKPVPVPSVSPSVKPVPRPTKSAGKDDKDYDSMKKRMWVAGSFAIIFAITTVVLAYLVYRQRKINKELSGDPASSRLL